MTKISLQTYTVRKFMKPKKHMFNTLSKLKDLGINAIELARVDFSRKSIIDIADICKNLDIKVASTQIKFKYIKENIDWIIEMHKLLDCKNIVISVIPLNILKDKNKIVAFAKEMNEIGKVFKESGLNLCFHHHHFEFFKIDSELIFDILVENTKENYIDFVIDTYWVQRGGKNPETVISKYHDRIRLIHLRDYKNKFSLINGDFIATDCEIGQGNLDFIKIIKICIDANIEFMAIEQTTEKPFDSINTSIEYLTSIGFKDLL